MLLRKDVVYLLSGGQSNQDVNRSIGGKPSTTMIKNGLNNLFDDITRSEMNRGNIDYRCFYIKNGSNDTWQNLEIYILDQTEGGAFGYLGVVLANDEQQFNIITDNNVEGGFFTFDFDIYKDVQVNFDNDLDVWAANFQSALRSLDPLSDVEVSGLYFPNHSTASFQNKSFYTFRIYFTGRDGKRNQPYVYPNSNNLIVSSGECELISYKVIVGSPSNTIAGKISNKKQRPNKVVFDLTSKYSSIQLGDLKSGEYLPIWIMREAIPDAIELRDDKITVAVRGKSVNIE
jgi:hypothetical protein